MSAHSPTPASADFTAYLTSRRLSPQSVKLYQHKVDKALREQGGGDLLAILRDESLTLATRQSYRKALLHYAHYRGDQGLAARLRTAQLPGHAGRRHAAVGLSGPEYRRLLEALDAGYADFGAEGVRFTQPEWAQLTLIATTGLRIGDVLRLTGAQLRAVAADRAGAGVEITQKGDRLRNWVLSEQGGDRRAAELLAATVRSGEQVWQVGPPGPQDAAGRADHLRKCLLRLGQLAEVGPRVTPQLLRKAVADRLWELSQDERLVADALGHRSLETTRKHYLDHARPQQLQQALGRAIWRKDEKPE